MVNVNFSNEDIYLLADLAEGFISGDSEGYDPINQSVSCVTPLSRISQFTSLVDRISEKTTLHGLDFNSLDFEIDPIDFQDVMPF